VREVVNAIASDAKGVSEFFDCRFGRNDDGDRVGFCDGSVDADV